MSCIDKSPSVPPTRADYRTAPTDGCYWPTLHMSTRKANHHKNQCSWSGKEVWTIMKVDCWRWIVDCWLMIDNCWLDITDSFETTPWIIMVEKRAGSLPSLLHSTMMNHGVVSNTVISNNVYLKKSWQLSGSPIYRIIILWTLSSGGERCLHTAEVAGSNPAASI